ncbi:MAG: hypothetical protein APF77_08195 [Clostridia bacterium BRH_c25]|nr:MAG: hypothetical protein APF77_08195 [Clostridia bacterium BRH_c25]
MDNGAYEKIVTGRSLSNIFGDIGKLSTVESYLIHVETIDGAENNFIEGAKNGRREIEGLYVSKDNMTNLKMI